MKWEAESLVVVAQNESARTNLLKSKIDRSQEELLILRFLEMRGLRTKRRNPADNYMFKVKNRNTRSRCEICSKLTLKTPERHHWRRSGVFIVNFEHISHLVLVFLLLTLSR